MRLGIVGPSAPYRGGIAQYTTSLFHAVAPLHPCLIVSFARQYPRLLFPGKTQEDTSPGALEAVGERILDPLSPGSWNAAVDRLREFEADIVLFQWWQPFFGLAYSAMLRKLKRHGTVTILLCHNVLPHESHPWPISAIERDWTRRAFAKATGFLVHSASLEKQLRVFRPDARVEQIYHPVYEFLGEPGPVQERRDGPLRMLFFGKVRRYKGLEVFLDALNMLAGKIEYEAVIAGEFYLPESEFKSRLTEAAAAGVKWINRYIPNAEVADLFSDADVLVLPYRHASQSGIIPQAYQFGLPVIASDVGGLSEVVVDGQTGYLFPAGDSEALAAKVMEFLVKRDTHGFAAAAREFRSRLSWVKWLIRSAFSPTAQADAQKRSSKR